eukprot:s760_g14.t1
MKEQQESMSRKAAIEKERAGENDGESVKILLYLFGFLLFGTFLVELGEAALLDDGHHPKMDVPRRGSPLRNRGQRLGGTPLRNSATHARRPVGARRSMTPRTRQPIGKAKQTRQPEFIEPVTLERQEPNGACSLLADAVLASEEDKWSGIHQSLEGLSSLIAQIGSPDRANRSGLHRTPVVPEANCLGIWQGPASFHDFHDFHECGCSLSLRYLEDPFAKLGRSLGNVTFHPGMISLLEVLRNYLPSANLFCLARTHPTVSYFLPKEANIFPVDFGSRLDVQNLLSREDQGIQVSWETCPKMVEFFR